MTQLIKEDEKKLTLTERLEMKKQNKSKGLILDISGSMTDEIEPGFRKIDALRDIVKELKGGFTTIVFNSHACVKENRKIPEPSGGTVMSSAFKLTKENGIREAIMITDGDCNQFDKEAALHEVEGLKLQIMYVGKPELKPEFLDQLARCSGTLVTTEDLKKVKEVTGKVQLFLSAAKVKKDGPICL
jgi:hypothetical protein